jgi:hypothetical protein
VWTEALQCSIPGRRKDRFSLFNIFQAACRVHLASCPVYTWGKVTKNETGHSSPSSISARCYSSTPLYVFMTWCLIKDKITLPFPFSSCPWFCTIQLWIHSLPSQIWCLQVNMMAIMYLPWLWSWWNQTSVIYLVEILDLRICHNFTLWCENVCSSICSFW